MTRHPAARQAIAVLAVLVAGLGVAARASATVTISSTGLGGTTSIQAIDDNPVDLSLQVVDPAVMISTPQVTCNTTAMDVCDEVVSLGDGSEIVAGAGCVKDSPQGQPVVLCPDVGIFTATLGSGNDGIAFDGDLEYQSATIDGGAGNDALVGANPTTPAFPDVDTFSGGQGDDTLKGMAGNDVLNDGPGADLIEGGAGNDTVDGGDGPDFLYGGTGDDTESGGAGNDKFTGEQGSDAGNDTFIGGPGQDTLDYLGSSQGVSVSLDGAANDGQPGEADNVMPDLEEVDGTIFADTLTAGAAGATLNGNGGNDTLIGGAGNDTLIGGAGDDTETGGGGADSFFGDDLSCSTGFTGSCDVGNDTINAVDGIADQVSCGPGADIANVDVLDVVATDPINGCEAVNRTQRPSAPTVLTGTASRIGPTTATVSGTVNPNGSAVLACRIEYGTTGAYGASVPCAKAVGGGAVSISVSGALSALHPATLYHYRLTATNAGGSVVGVDHVLTTSKRSSTRCVVPRLLHMTMSTATRALRRAHCRLGHVHSPHRIATHHRLRVVNQSARPRTTHPPGYRVAITVA